MVVWTYFHQMDPFLLPLTESFGIRWYSLAYIAGFLMGYWLIKKWLVDSQCSPLNKTQAMDQVTWGVIGVLIGGRLGYACFYDFNLFTDFDSNFPYWELLKIHRGGLASHGGIAGLAFASFLFAKTRKLPAFHCIDVTVLGGSLGVFFGRIANFINGELYGRVIQEKALIAVQFPQEMLTWVSEKQVNLLHRLTPAVTALNKNISANSWQDWVQQLNQTDFSSQALSKIYSVIHSLIAASQEGKAEVISSLREILFLRHPSQIYQAFLEGLFPFLIIWFIWRKKARTPGMIAGLWGSCYLIFRIIGEEFRMPDAHLGFQALGLTRGQWLSAAMALLMGIYFFIVLKSQKNAKKWGGWAKK